MGRLFYNGVKSSIFLLVAFILCCSESSVVINEYFPNPDSYSDDEYLSNEWVELYNTGSDELDISGFEISDFVGNAIRIEDNIFIEGYGFFVLEISWNMLNNDGDTIFLCDREDTILDIDEYLQAPKCYSKSRFPDGGEWSLTWAPPTPGYKNSESNYNSLGNAKLPERPDGSFFLASWNIENLGTAKIFNRPKALDVIVSTIIEYDIIAIQELSSIPPEGGVCGEFTSEALCHLANVINSESDSVWDFTVSDRVNGQEQYLVIYRTDLFKLAETALFTKDDLFTYPPQVTGFVYKPTNDVFFIVNVHTSPQVARTEIWNLPELILDLQLSWEYVFILGDLNADEGAVQSFVPGRDWPFFFEQLEDGWENLITDGTKTAVLTDNTYDRIIISPALSDYDWILKESAGVFRIDGAWNFTEDEMREYASDHYPVHVVVCPYGECGEQLDEISGKSPKSQKSPKSPKSGGAEFERNVYISEKSTIRSVVAFAFGISILFGAGLKLKRRRVSEEF